MRKLGVRAALGAAAGLLALVLSAATASAAHAPPGSYQATCTNVRVSQGNIEAFCQRYDGSSRFAVLYDYAECTGDIRNEDGRLVCARGGSQLPPGSWRQSCRNYRIEGQRLIAECRNDYGRWISSDIYYRNCTGEIVNRNGRLACDDSVRLPGGDWTRSCRNYRLDGWVLKAQCRDRNGDWRYTELNIRYCRDDVSNQNGRLVCGGSDLPSGSWSDSCRNAYVENRILYAQCRDRRGRWRDTQLDLRTCRRQPVSNDNGRLVCGEAYSLPSGSWRNSCRNYRIDGSMLEAECRDNSGRYRYTELDLRACRQPVSNRNGRLVCGDAYDLPPGSWRNSCRNYSMDGSVLEAECRDRYGAWRFSTLDLRDCDEPVSNRNGRLTCGDDYEERIIRCESRDNRYQECAADTRDGVRLHRQLSISPCIEGRSWGYDRNGIWVDQGCRAEFRLGY